MEYERKPVNKLLSSWVGGGRSQDGEKNSFCPLPSSLPHALFYYCLYRFRAYQNKKLIFEVKL